MRYGGTWKQQNKKRSGIHPAYLCIYECAVHIAVNNGNQQNRIYGAHESFSLFGSVKSTENDREGERVRGRKSRINYSERNEFHSIMKHGMLVSFISIVFQEFLFSSPLLPVRFKCAEKHILNGDCT